MNRNAPLVELVPDDGRLSEAAAVELLAGAH